MMRIQRQIVAARFGGPEVLELLESPAPSAGRGELLVRVEAAGVLYGDAMRRTGRYPFPTELPYKPGAEIAGTVEEVGPGVQGWDVGARLMALVGTGGYPRYAVIDPARAIPLPAAIGFDEATGLLAQGLTAYLLTHEVSDPSGKSVFVEAAAGGVGSMLVQLARARGARLIVGAVGADEKEGFARRNGCDAVVLSREPDWPARVLDATDGVGVDLAFEASGNLFQHLLTCVSPFGTLVKFGKGVDENLSLAPSALLGKNQGVRGFYLPGFLAPERAEVVQRAIREMVALRQAGKLKVEIGRSYTLPQAELAHRDLEGRLTVGKLVFQPWSDQHQ